MLLQFDFCSVAAAACCAGRQLFIGFTIMHPLQRLQRVSRQFGNRTHETKQLPIPSNHVVLLCSEQRPNVICCLAISVRPYPVVWVVSSTCSGLAELLENEAGKLLGKDHLCS